MSEKRNIEELFRDQLGGIESDPGPGVWESIQSRIPTTGAQAATSSGSLISGKLVAVIAGVSVVAGLGVGYLLGGKDQTQNLQENTSITTKDINVDESVQPLTTEEDLSIPETVIIEEKNTGNKTGAVRKRIDLKETPPGSTASSWITPQDKRKPFSATKTENGSSNDGAKNTSTVNPASTTTNLNTANSVIAEDKKPGRTETSIEEGLPLAVIAANVSGGPAPLYVEFKSVYPGYSVEWNFGDGKTSRETAVIHKFEEPGSYLVTLTLKDAKGNIATDQVSIQVREGSVVNFPNVFSPNGDGVNDVFTCKECRNLESIFVQVTDMGGRLLYETNQLNFEWDGRDRSGNPVGPGVYIFHYRATDIYGKEYKKASTLTVQ